MKKAGEGIDFDFSKQLGESYASTCAKHGDYTAYTLCRTCPTCLEDAEVAKRRENAARAKLELREQKWIEAGMPPKFAGVSMTDWLCRTKAHHKAYGYSMMVVKGERRRLLMVGRCGTGKTMLAAGMMREWSRINNWKLPTYVTATRMIRYIRDSWKTGASEQEAFDRFSKAEFLCIDELGAGRCSDDDRQMLSEVLCDRYSSDLPTVLISNLTADELKETVIDERASDRFRENAIKATFDWEGERGGASHD